MAALNVATFTAVLVLLASPSLSVDRSLIIGDLMVVCQVTGHLSMCLTYSTPGT